MSSQLVQKKVGKVPRKTEPPLRQPDHSAARAPRPSTYYIPVGTRMAHRSTSVMNICLAKVTYVDNWGHYEWSSWMTSVWQTISSAMPCPRWLVQHNIIRCNCTSKGKGKVVKHFSPITVNVAVSLASTDPHSVSFRVLLTQLPVYLHIKNA